MNEQSNTGACCHFVNKGLAPASYIFFLAFESRDRRDVSIYGYMCTDILIPVCRLHNLIFFVLG
jgi:hypothetical protein